MLKHLVKQYTVKGSIGEWQRFGNSTTIGQTREIELFSLSRQYSPDFDIDSHSTLYTPF
jgi:hypothetical protein